jgi:hypothetical protein
MSDVQCSSQIANNKFMFSLGNSPDLQQNKFIETVYGRRERGERRSKSPSKTDLLLRDIQLSDFDYLTPTVYSVRDNKTTSY